MSEFKLTTPVAFCVFNRLDCTIEVFSRIREAKPSKLYVIADGARANKEGESEKVQEVRDYISSHVDWDCEVKYNYAEKNMGCKYRIYSGISWVFENEEQAIIVEDDCVPNLDFFRFCQELLDLYKEDKNVWLIGGTNLIRKQKSKDPYFFTKFPDIWGWATWRRAWQQCDVEMSSWEHAKKAKSIRYAYDFWSYRCYLRVADHQVRLKRDTWDVPWIYSMTLNHGIAITAGENLVSNVGCGREDATNTVTGVEYDYDFSYGSTLSFPLEKKLDMQVDEKYDRAYLKERWGWNKEKQYIKYLFTRIVPKLKEMFN